MRSYPSGADRSDDWCTDRNFLSSALLPAGSFCPVLIFDNAVPYQLATPRPLSFLRPFPRPSLPVDGCLPDMDTVSAAKTYHLEILQQPSLGCAFENNLLSRIGLAAPLILELQVKDANGQDVDASDELPFLICQCSLLEEDDDPADMAVLPPEQSVMGQSNTPASSFSSSASAAGRPGDRISRSSGGKAPPPRASMASSTTADSSATSVDGISAALRNTTVSGAPGFGRMLYGTIVTNPRTLDSADGSRKPYLLFPEISIRAVGRFKIQCQLMRLVL